MLKTSATGEIVKNRHALNKVHSDTPSHFLNGPYGFTGNLTFPATPCVCVNLTFCGSTRTILKSSLKVNYKRL